MQSAAYSQHQCFKQITSDHQSDRFSRASKVNKIRKIKSWIAIQTLWSISSSALENVIPQMVQIAIWCAASPVLSAIILVCFWFCPSLQFLWQWLASLSWWITFLCLTTNRRALNFLSHRLQKNFLPLHMGKCTSYREVFSNVCGQWGHLCFGSMCFVIYYVKCRLY